MKKLLKLFVGTLILLILLIVMTKISGNGYLLKGIWASYFHGHFSASIDDSKFFDTHTVEASVAPSEWPLHRKYNQQELSARLKKTLSETESVSFLIIQNDSILLEQYWKGYSEKSQSNSFSMAKSITTLLCQIAIQKGILSGWDQKVKNILPSLPGAYAAELELWHLSTMSSGLDWNEKYTNPFNITAKAYYGNELKELMLKLPIITEPGKVYNYQSGSTQLLGLCLTQATGKTLSFLASEWLWKPMQAKNDATWHTDEEGTELAYCCFNSNARDFARFGKLMLHHGKWNDLQILDSSFIALATTAKLVPYYGYSFWIDHSEGIKVFYQRGILGQYIITIPDYHLVIVRLGEHQLPSGSDRHPKDFHIIVEEVLKMTKTK